ncbi:MAG: archaellin/type IV pilin N-terminal domain-containing protein [Nitrososphaerales archaeon]
MKRVGLGVSDSILVLSIAYSTSDARGKGLNRSKKGISPVVATVILVAVAVVIAGALSGFSSSLFGTYSSSGSIAIKTMTMDVDGDGSIELVNRGALGDSVDSVHVPGVKSNGGKREPLKHDEGGSTYESIYLETSCPGNAGTAPEVKPNSEALICFINADLKGKNSNEFEPGQRVTVKIKMVSGLEITQTLVVEK